MIVRTIAITYAILAIRLIIQNLGLAEPDRIYFEIPSAFIAWLILAGIGIAAAIVINEKESKE